MADPRSSETERAYLRRYRQLKARARTALAGRFTTDAFVGFLCESIRPGLSPASWRQYRAAALVGLRNDLAHEPRAAQQLDAALHRLAATPPALISNREPRTSQQKAKRLSNSDIDRIRQHLATTRSANRQALDDYLLAASVAALRPAEWPSAQWRTCTLPSLRWELVVVNAKNSHGRSHGPTRTLRFAEIESGIVRAITSWIVTAARAAADGTYQRLLKTLGGMLRKLGRRAFPRRRRRPTLYTPRHEAAARWKARYVQAAANNPQLQELGRATVAALLGHATDETASRHYARPRRGESGSDLPVPTADPAEIARVRRQFSASLERRSAKTLHPPA
jgi:hypothetical protein